MADNEGSTSKANIPKLDNTKFLHWSMRMKDHLRHKGLIKYITKVPGTLAGAAAYAVNKKHAETIVHLEESQKTLSGQTSKASNKASEEQTDSAAALMHKSKKGKKKGCRGPYCAPGKHNPEATSHDAEHCWKLHPEQRQNSSKTPMASNHPTTKLVEADDGHELEVSLLLTESASKPTVLNSGATHHLINNPDLFHPTADSNIKISTGGHSNFLNASAVRSATLINHCGKKLILKNALLYQLSITNTADKCASLHSSHFEAMHSQSSCYHPKSPNAVCVNLAN
ncbi:hypothetical protein VP01_3407g1 [Puccinia sorghi]|uniref:Uncharacterized protein n=1 Tax=Puccinia sorghi TaxID=27349 RepID=A0A0L6UWM8_9BASI|nr:hypothetical protein VP01_3407g1 [Puccinia sorghi]